MTDPAAPETKPRQANRLRTWGLVALAALVLLLPLILLRTGWNERRRLQGDIDTWVSTGMGKGPHADRIRSTGTNLLTLVVATLDTPDESPMFRALGLFRVQARLGPAWRWSNGWKARQSLALLDPAAKRGIARLLLELAGAALQHDPNTRYWRNVSKAFLNLGPEGLEASQEAMKTGSPRDRLAAIRLWNATGRAVPEAAHASVAGCLTEASFETRYLALVILARSKPANPKVIQAVSRLLSDEDEVIRRTAMPALMRFGPVLATHAAEDLKRAAANDTNIGGMAQTLLDQIRTLSP